MKNLIIKINGPIGSGKTTLVEKLEKEYENCYIVGEHVDDGIGNVLLQNYYKNPKKYAFEFSKYMLNTKLKRIMEINLLIQEKENVVIIFDRSIEYDIFVFDTTRYHNHYVSFDEFIQLYSLGRDINIFIKEKFNNFEVDDRYLFESFEECFDRIKKRSRKGEVIDESYSKEIYDLHNATYFRLNNGEQLFY